MFPISTRLPFKWANAQSQISHHAQWRIDVLVNLVIISVIYKLVSYSSPKHHDIMITSSHYHIVNMDVIQTFLQPMSIHLYLLSVLKVPIALGCTLRVSTSKIKSILGEIPGII